VAKILRADTKVGTQVHLQIAPDPPLVLGQIVLFDNAITATGGSANNLVVGTIYYVKSLVDASNNFTISLTNGGVAY